MSIFKKNFKKGDRIRCIRPDRSDSNLTKDKVYTTTHDEKPGIFKSDPYIRLIGDMDRPFICHSSRFDLVATKEQVAYSEQHRQDGE